MVARKHDNPEPSQAAQMQALGRRIRDERAEQGWSLNELAARADVSRAMLSKVERGESSPTVNVLQKIARALGLSPGSLIGLEPNRPLVVLRAGAGRTFTEASTGYVRQIFPAIEGSPAEFVRATVPGHGSSGPLAIHPAGTRKYVAVERGTVRLAAGRDEVVLRTGDICLFPADIEHEFHNPGARPCTLLMVKLVGR